MMIFWILLSTICLAIHQGINKVDLSPINMLLVSGFVIGLMNFGVHLGKLL